MWLFVCKCYTNPQKSHGKGQSVGATFLYFWVLWVQSMIRSLLGTELWGNEEGHSMMTCTSPRFEVHTLYRHLHHWGQKNLPYRCPYFRNGFLYCYISGERPEMSTQQQQQQRVNHAVHCNSHTPLFSNYSFLKSCYTVSFTFLSLHSVTISETTVQRCAANLQEQC